MCYLKAGLQQKRAISYFNTLVTRIKSVESYKDELPVTVINGYGINDFTVCNFEAP